MNYAHPLGTSLPAYIAGTTTKVDPREGDPATRGVTLASGTTYVFPLGGESAPLESIHIMWDAAIIVTFTVEDCNMPKGLNGASAPPYDISDTENTIAGAWIQQNPPTAYVPGGTGFAVTNLTIAVAGGTANGTMIHLGNFASKRSRLKATVAGTGGVVRVAAHGKA